MNRLLALLLVLLVLLGNAALAHHSVPGEFGDSSRPTTYMEGELVKIIWRNPHIFLNIRTISGDGVEAGENWRVTSHPTHIMDETYDFRADQFAVGDIIKMHGWKHLRGQPLFHPRALQVNDGPMRSLLRFADARDIVAGTLLDKGIVPTKTLDGSNPGRAGQETVDALREMGFLDENNLIRLPEEFKQAAGME